jgi:NADPH:quinone reductase-like Zn-dependent oxidoreductase
MEQEDKSEDVGVTKEESMSAASKRELAGQTVVVIGGTSGIGLETVRRAKSWREGDQAE